MDDTTRVAIKTFCAAELNLRDMKDTYRQQCETPSVSRNHCYNTLVRRMTDDGVDTLEIPSGGFLRKSTVKTQCSLKPDLVAEAARAAVQDLQDYLRNEKENVQTIMDARTMFEQSLQKRVRESRTSQLTSVKFVETVPASVQVEHVADADTMSTVKRWMDARHELAKLRETHTKQVKDAEAVKMEQMDIAGVKNFMKKECGQGRPVTISSHPGKFMLKYSESRRRNPIRGPHLKDAIKHAVDTLLVDAAKISASELSERVTSIIMERAIENAGSVESDTFTLCSRTGRKRAADGTQK